MATPTTIDVSAIGCSRSVLEATGVLEHLRGDGADDLAAPTT